MWNNLTLLFKTYLFFSLNLSQQFWGEQHEPAKQCILKIHLPTECHMYLIIIQKHSIIFHLPLPQKYLGGGAANFKRHHWRNVLCLLRPKLVWSIKTADWLRSVYNSDWRNVSHASLIPAPTVGTYHLGCAGHNTRTNTKM